MKERARKKVLSLIAVCIAVAAAAQVEDDKPVGVSELPRWDHIRGAVDRSEVNRQLSWEWEELGPFVQPEELNPGGRAIPAYARNRGNGTGRINYLFVHPRFPDQVWACSPTGGVWRTTDGGKAWTPAGTDRLEISGVSSIAVHPANTEKWVVATGDGDDLFMYSDGVWMTEDGGATYRSLNGRWEQARLPFGGRDDASGQISEVVAEPRKMKRLFAATNRGLWVTSARVTPERVQWFKAADGYFYDVEIIPGKRRRKDTVIAAGDRLVVSYDGGYSWQVMPLPDFPGKDGFPFVRLSVEYSPARPGVVFIAVTCSERVSQSALGEGSLYEFNLADHSWKFIRSLRRDMNNVIPPRARAFAVSPVNANVLMCGNIQPLFRSTNGGISFERIEKNQMHDDCHHIVFAPDGKTVWAAHDGGVSRSTDGGIHFETRDSGIGAANVFGLSVAQSTAMQVLFGGYDVGGNLLKEEKWWHVSWGDGFETIIHPSDPAVMFSTMQNGSVQRSTTGMDFEESAGPVGARTEWHTWIRMHPLYNDLVFCAGARLSRSRDLGRTWETIFDAAAMDSSLYNAYRFFLSPDHPGVMYVYVLDKQHVHPQVWRTMNITAPDPRDITWERCARVPEEGWIMQICVDPDDPGKFWMLYNKTERQGKFWYWDGQDWIDQTGNLGGSKCESMVLQKGADKRLYIGSNYGIFTKKSGEAQWTLLTGLPGTFIKSLDINYPAGKLVVGTFGRGVWTGDLVPR